MAHVDAGKTTLTERILLYSGKISTPGEVHEGTAVTDFLQEERERGITISSAAVDVNWNCNGIPHNLTFIDTPGHTDFTFEVTRALFVVDGVVAVIDSVAGVQAQTKSVWNQANKRSLPRIVFVNKLDRVGASLEKSVNDLVKEFKIKPLILQKPIYKGGELIAIADLVRNQKIEWTNESGSKMKYSDLPPEYISDREKLFETLSDLDEEFMELYLTEKVNLKSLQNCLKRLTINQIAIPILCGSAYKNKGVQPLLDGIVSYLPSPSNIQTDLPKNDLTAFSFKVSQLYNSILVFVRVYSGELRAGIPLSNGDRVMRVVKVDANSISDVNTLERGQIGAIVGLKKTKTGETLLRSGDKRKDLSILSMKLPEPVYYVAIEPKSQKDEEKLQKALELITREDPSIVVSTNKDQGQTLLSGQGELHLEIIKHNLLNIHNVPVDISDVQIAYRESIQKNINNTVEWKRYNSSGEITSEILVDLFLEQGENNSELKLKDVNVFNSKQKNNMKEGIKDGLSRGVLYGYPLENINVSIKGLRVSKGNGSIEDIRTSIAHAIWESVKEADPTMLEPMMHVEVECPEKAVGTVLGDISGKRRGQVQNVSRDKISVKVPLSSMQGYSTTLRSLTAGEGSFSMHFSHYEKCDTKSVESQLGISDF